MQSFHVFLRTFPDEYFWKSTGASRKAAPIAIPVDVSNASYQKAYVLFCILRSAYDKFVDISMETFIKVFLVL